MKNYLYMLATDQKNDFLAKILKLFLFLLALVYGLVIRILVFIYSFNPYRAPCKVISVGNITLGGTGKTSLVELIARYLKTEGKNIVVISRGYKRPETRDQNMGDEPEMLFNNLGSVPVIADKDRVRAIKRAVNEYKADTVILDDALQQWRIKKDLEVVTIDAGNPFGNKHMLPRGILREPLSVLKRTDIFVLTKVNFSPDIQATEEFLHGIAPEALVLESTHEPVAFYEISKPSELLNLESLRSRNVALVSGIGDPGSFENLIKSLGINIGLCFRFSDHYNYQEKDFIKIVNDAKAKGIDIIITTEKDAVRINTLRPAQDAQRKTPPSAWRILVLRIKLRVKDEQRLYQRLLRIYSA